MRVVTAEAAFLHLDGRDVRVFLSTVPRDEASLAAVAVELHVRSPN